MRANSTLSEHIATYRFRVEKSADYIVWIEVLGTSLRDNSVSLYIDQYRQKTVHSVIRSAQPAWTWNYLDQKVRILLQSLSHVAVGSAVRIPLLHLPLFMMSPLHSPFLLWSPSTTSFHLFLGLPLGCGPSSSKLSANCAGSFSSLLCTWPSHLTRFVFTYFKFQTVCVQ